MKWTKCVVCGARLPVDASGLQRARHWTSKRHQDAKSGDGDGVAKTEGAR